MRSRKKSGRLSGDRRNAFRLESIPHAECSRPLAECIPLMWKGLWRGSGRRDGDREDQRAARERVEPLIYYLYGPGRRRSTPTRIRRGLAAPAELEPPLREDGERDFRRLFGLLNQPHAAMGTWGFARPVWHCSMRAAPEDKTLSDDEWAQIACDVMHRTGLAPSGEEDDAVRWVAIRHGEDHIHLVAMLARQDGRRPRLSNERYRVRDACLAAEQRYGLRPTAPGDRTAARCPSRAESEKAARRGLEEAPRVALRRQVSTAAAAAGREQEFVDRLRQPACSSAPAAAPAILPSSPGTPSPFPATPPGPRTRSGTRRETRRGPEPAQAAAPLAPARQR
jgi:hypothetical protein